MMRVLTHHSYSYILKSRCVETRNEAFYFADTNQGEGYFLISKRPKNREASCVTTTLHLFFADTNRGEVLFEIPLRGDTHRGF
jgi:hypothetical protein